MVYLNPNVHTYLNSKQVVLLLLLFRQSISLCRWFKLKICWLTAEFRHQGIPSTTSKRCLLAAASLLFSSDTITYALDLLCRGILNIKLGPFNADSGAVSLAEQLYAPLIIFIRINVSHTLVDLDPSYFYSTFVLMLLLCGGLGLYAKVHSPIWSLLLVCLELLVSLSTTFTACWLSQSVFIAAGCLPNQSWSIYWSHPDRCICTTGFWCHPCCCIIDNKCCCYTSDPSQSMVLYMLICCL